MSSDYFRQCRAGLKSLALLPLSPFDKSQVLDKRKCGHQEKEVLARPDTAWDLELQALPDRYKIHVEICNL